jgi:hypothetical protein
MVADGLPSASVRRAPPPAPGDQRQVGHRRQLGDVAPGEDLPCPLCLTGDIRGWRGHHPASSSNRKAPALRSVAGRRLISMVQPTRLARAGESDRQSYLLATAQNRQGCPHSAPQHFCEVLGKSGALGIGGPSASRPPIPVGRGEEARALGKDQEWVHASYRIETR